MKFRKKPVVINAWKISELIRDAGRNWKALPREIMEIYESGRIIFAPEYVLIPTPEGSMIGNFDDWLIMGIKGEFYPCKPDIFAATYEALD